MFPDCPDVSLKGNLQKQNKIKCGDGLHWYKDSQGNLAIRHSDDNHKKNCFAATDLKGPEVVLYPHNGAVFDKKEE